MSARLSSLGAHLRRQRAVYAFIGLALYVSPVPSMAAALVTTDQIANSAITTPKLAVDSVISTRILDESITSGDIKNGTIAGVDLRTSAMGAKVIRYDVGYWEFGSNTNESGQGSVSVQLPGTWTAAIVAASSWSATVKSVTPGTTDTTIVVPGTYNGAHIELMVHDDGRAVILCEDGGAVYDDISIYRTVTTSTQVTPPTPPAP
ncbi:hypothetical protein F0U44_15020 [Nocardioides humilatus]|uniref:Uncharacterized protein n=1 Tax=Nocardioides humilatus TaxID=2607660 RepID=A0A5B1LBD0_9ACTN|nr:hypothetical protein [Nocardioides humilatus]KAA1417945.1 hypothetical protein F0U44_15020 [Nocardioides humilatus]